MTDIPDINSGVSLSEVLPAAGAVRRRDDDFVKDPSKPKDYTKPKDLDELIEKEIESGEARRRSARFEDQAQGATEDVVSRLVRSLTEIEIERERSAEAERLPDREPGAASFAREESGNERAIQGYQDRIASLEGSLEQQFDREASREEFRERLSNVQEQGIATRDQRFQAQLQGIGERKDRFLDATAEANQEFTDVRNEAVQEGFNVRDEAVNRRDFENAEFNQDRADLDALGVSRQNNEQARFDSIQESLALLASEEEQSIDQFVSSSRNQVSQEDAIFGAREIEQAISSNQFSDALRLLGEQEALAVLRNQPNAVVVGSNVVEGVADDGSVTQVRLEEDSALQNPGQGLFFDTEAQRDLGNILNGRG